MKLICLPFAGGDISYFYRFKKYLNTEFDIVDICLNSRGVRISTPCYQNFSEMLEDIFSQIDIPEGEEYIIFGHSMGGLLGYELYYKLIERYKRPPKKIFISACKPPHLINKKIRIPNERLSNIDYMAEVVKLGGTPAEILDYPDLVDLLTPVLKQDFQNIRQYNFQKKKRKIDCPVTVFFGIQDEVNREDMEGWKMFTENTFEIIPFTGNHFFISDHVQEIAEIINELVAS
ncbi:thioesterase II family protein [Streptococcus mutans]|uniref:thioesterase II family protein n=1 Tax=Streptococcus mutans TaxID=1309 RepID=UPI0038BC9F9A